MKSTFFTLAIVTGAIGLIALIGASNALNEVFAGIIGLGSIILFCAGAFAPTKEKRHRAQSPSSSVRYDPNNIPEPKSKRPPSAVRYP